MRYFLVGYDLWQGAALVFKIEVPLDRVPCHCICEEGDVSFLLDDVDAAELAWSCYTTPGPTHLMYYMETDDGSDQNQ